MIRLRVVAVVVLLVLALGGQTVSAQCNPDDPLCPSGAMPWPVPRLWPLDSPTPYTPVPTPTALPITGTPTPTPTVTNTPTITPTFPSFGTEQADYATLSADIDILLQTVGPMAGTPVNVGDAPWPLATTAAQLGEVAGNFFGYVKGINIMSVRGTEGILFWLLLCLAFVIGVTIITNLIPLIGAIINWVIKIGQLLGEWIPG